MCFMASAVGAAYGGDYYTYQDANGKLVLSNNPPPPARKILKKQTLDEVTDREIAEAQARVGTGGLDYRLSNLERAVGDLEYNLRAQPSAVDNVQPDYGEGGGLIVGVTNGFVRPRHPPMRRPVGPPPSSLPGGIIPPGSLPGGKIPAGSLPGGKLG
jgi:Domain of unknown function (DUF4124)